LYYSDTPFFQSQCRSNRALDSVCVILDVPRFALNILSTPKGKVIGDLQFRTHDGIFIDCNEWGSTGATVPTHVERLSAMTSKAKYVLLIEKDSTFMRLSDEKYHLKYGPCILITGKGIPDIPTRLLVKKIHTELGLPILGLVDFDPYGVEILLVYSCGSKHLEYDKENLATHGIKWLGLHAEDVQSKDISPQTLIPLTPHDRHKAELMLARPTLTKEHKLWAKQLEAMLEMGVKAEIQSLASISLAHLATEYLPTKIMNRKWI